MLQTWQIFNLSMSWLQPKVTSQATTTNITFVTHSALERFWLSTSSYSEIHNKLSITADSSNDSTQKAPRSPGLPEQEHSSIVYNKKFPQDWFNTLNTS
jgi:hypothetical protein